MHFGRGMHVLLVHQVFAALDEAGGTRHHEMARYLAARGCRVTIVAGSISYLSGKAQPGGRKLRLVEREQDGPNITILRAYTYPAFHRSFFHRVLSFLSFMISSFLVGLSVPDVDLVWGTSPPIFQGATAWALARLKRVPFLFEVRDLWPAFAIAMGVLKNPLLIRLTYGLERFLYQRADRLMVNSPGFIEHVTERGGRWVELVPNGADPTMFDPDADGAGFREKYGLGSDFVALYAGAHGVSNDLEVVLDAACLLKDDQRVRFVFLGDGKEKPGLVSRAQQMGLKNVSFIPPIPKTEMSAALAAADACIAILKPIPLYATTYPNKVFDYMAAGRPVVLAIDGVIRRVIEEAEAGIAVSPGDPDALAEAVRRLAACPDRGRSLGLAGRRAVEKQFSRQALSEKLFLLLADMGRMNG